MATSVEDSTDSYISRRQQSWLQEQKIVLIATSVEDSSHGYRSRGQYIWLHQQKIVHMATSVEDSSHGYRSRGQYTWLHQQRIVHIATGVEDSTDSYINRRLYKHLQEQRTVLIPTAVDDSTQSYSSGGQYSYLLQWRTVLKATVVEDSTQSYCSGGQYSKLQQQRTVQIPTGVEDSTYGYMCTMVQYSMICLATQKYIVGILIQQYSRVQYAWLHRRGVQESLYSSIVEFGMPGYTKVYCRDPHTVVQQSIVCFAMYEQSVGIISWQNSTVWYPWLHRSRVWFSLYSSIVRCGMLVYRVVECRNHSTVVSLIMVFLGTEQQSIVIIVRQYSTVQYGSCGCAVSRVLCRELCVTSTVVLFLPT